jgi:hypothetical protein
LFIYSLEIHSALPAGEQGAGSDQTGGTNGEHGEEIILWQQASKQKPDFHLVGGLEEV